ncbi:transposable element tc3 transposase-like protein [Holotrichia oblita]|uniref:Transposable element tc3 transposase-like protein n=1 Tax=Holotrichia oblita TaxID=644536 RepID=A0ACB9TYU5_HOLOL|nr:transposable element tc3 transposase-like protein [Holotrichia oblita]
MPTRLNYTNEDYLNLFIIYGECNKVISRTCDTFAARYPQKQKPPTNTVKRVIQNFKNFGSVNAKTQKHKPIVNNADMEIDILGYFTTYPTMSLRQAALESGLSRCSIHRILRKQKFRPYLFSVVQHLKDIDFPRRVSFCEFILTWSQENPLFLGNIIWTDEAKFTKNGVHNRHNFHYWSDSNPRVVRMQNFQESWQFNVFCAVRNDDVVALHFYEENLNGKHQYVF